MTTFVHCRGCGHKIHETAHTCPQCGAPQQIATQQTATAQPATTAKLITSIEDTPWFRRRWFFVVCVLIFIPAALLIAFTGDVYYLHKGELKTLAKKDRNIILILFICLVVVNVFRAVVDTSNTETIQPAVEKPSSSNRIDSGSLDGNSSATYDDNVVQKKKQQGFLDNPENFKLPMDEVAKLKGQDAVSILLIPQFKTYVDNIWYKTPNIIENRLTRSFLPVDETEHYFIGVGCMEGRCRTDSVMWAVDKVTQMPIVYVIYTEGNSDQVKAMSLGIKNDARGMPIFPQEVVDWIATQKEQGKYKH